MMRVSAGRNDGTVSGAGGCFFLRVRTRFRLSPLFPTTSRLT